MDAGIVVLMGLLCLATLAGGGWAAISAHQARVAALPEVGKLVAEFTAVRAETQAIRAEWAQTLRALDSALEALEEQSGTVRRHRTRIEQSERRRAQAEQQQTEEDPMSAALRAARAQGLPV